MGKYLYARLPLQLIEEQQTMNNQIVRTEQVQNQKPPTLAPIVFTRANADLVDVKLRVARTNYDTYVMMFFPSVERVRVIRTVCKNGLAIYGLQVERLLPNTKACLTSPMIWVASQFEATQP